PQSAESDPIVPCHKSLWDYLTDKNRSEFHHVDRSLHQLPLLKACLQVLMSELETDLLREDVLNSRSGNITFSSEPMKRRISPQLRYACLFWTFHLSLVKYDQSVDCIVRKFLENNLL
ncbi:hypothetical protein SISNIDRAFT_400478, partial [Sistotremastrum niveocremeum HHB9708]